MDKNSKNEKIVFGGGCFWCVEAVFTRLKGVISVRPGYAGGTIADPTYEQVSGGKTGHAEVIEVEYDPSQLDFGDLLTVFFVTHDPTTLNRQGHDIGTQYRSAIFYLTEGQKREAEKFKAILQHESSQEIVTEISKLIEFYPAEDYHKNYYAKNQEAAYCQLVIAPKIKTLQDNFQKILR